MPRRLIKWVVYIMLFSMLVMTFMAGLSALLL